VAFVTGVVAVGTTVFFMTVHTLGVKGIGAQRNVLYVRPFVFAQFAGGRVVMAAQTGFVTGEGLLVLDSELVIELGGVAGAACEEGVRLGVVMVTVGTLESIVFCMELMSKNDPAASVVHDDSCRDFLRRGGEHITDYRRGKAHRNDCRNE